jgi:hypothetical protein
MNIIEKVNIDDLIQEEESDQYSSEDEALLKTESSVDGVIQR